MFENEYKRQMDSITPDEALKAKIKESFYEAPTKQHRRTAVIYRIGFAAAACVALVLSLIFIPNNRNDFSLSPTPAVKTDGYLKAADDYDGIYKHFKALADKAKQNNDGDYYYTYEYEYGFAEDAEGDMAAPGGNKNSSTVTTDTSSSDIGAGKDDFSSTTTQVSGVDEADIVKTDGKYIYSLYRNRICITRANGKDTVQLSEISLSFNNDEYYQDMYISGNRLIVMGSIDTANSKSDFALFDRAYSYSPNTTMTVIDISDKAKPSVIDCVTQSGNYHSSRMIDGTVYVISRHYVMLSEIKKDSPDTFVPYVCYENGDTVVAAPSCIRYEEDYEGQEYVVACSYNAEDGELLSNSSILGSVSELYCSTENIITAAEKHREEDGIGYSYTVVSRFAIKDRKIEYVTSGEIMGGLLNQFSIDEHGGYFRFVTTTNSYLYYSDDDYGSVVSSRNVTTNALYVLDSELKEVGKIENIAPNERVYSVRFMGDTAYFVTFRQVDPLFSVDLSDPKNPTIIGSLKIPGFSDYLYPYGDGLLLGIGKNADEKTGRTGYMKLSMFDISNPANVSESTVKILDGIYESPALSSHKATLVSSDKNLIGFAVGKHLANSKFTTTYHVYGYKDGSFRLIAELPLINGDEVDHNLFDTLHNSRGLFIGNNFYIVNEIGVWVYSLDSMEKIVNIKF